MSVGGVVQQVCEALTRAHGLFGAGPGTGEIAVAGTGLADAAALTDAPRARMAALSGRLPARYDGVTDTTGARLARLVGTDDALTTHVSDADATHRAGHTDSGRVVDAGARDAARMSPLSGTPAGRRALLTALRDRVSQQQRVVLAYQVRAARMAASVRALSYGAPAPGAAEPRFGGGEAITGGPAPDRTAPENVASRVRPTASPASFIAAAPGGLSAWSSPRECAAALIDQARRRGYSPAQTVAMLSTMLQESGGDPRAVSPNGLWRGLFQQDAGYPGRDDPDVAITAFLTRLSAKGGPDAPDIWKSIFWLQQAPGAASAEAAYAQGRRASLREIQSQLGRAVAMYREVTGS